MLLVVRSKKKGDTGNLLVEEGISDKAPVEVRLDEVKSVTLTIMQTEVIVYIQISNILEMTDFFLFFVSTAKL